MDAATAPGRALKALVKQVPSAERKPVRPMYARLVLPRSAAGVLLVVLGIVLAAAQFSAGRLRAASSSSGFFQEATLYPSSQPQCTLTIPQADGAGSYSIYLVLPGGGVPSDYGMAFHEIRRYVSVAVSESAKGPALQRFPSTASLTDLPDQLGSDQAIELCAIDPSPDKPLIAQCRLGNGPPWPDSLRLGIAHSTASRNGSKLTLALAQSARPYIFGISGVLFVSGLALTRRGLIRAS